MNKPTKRPPSGVPSRQQILDFIAASPTSAGKREIARAFGLHGAEKILLKALLKDMTDEGLIDMAPGRAFHKMGGLPKVIVLHVVAADDGQVWASPEHWEAEGVPKPRVRVIERGRRSALAVGERILARTEEAGGGHIAHVMKRLARAEEMLLGVVEAGGAGRFWLKPVDKRIRASTPVSDIAEAKQGDLVLAERVGRGPRASVRVREILGDPLAPRAFSLIAIHKFGIPDTFPDEVLQEAARVARQSLGEGREDLRHLPIIAIDPVDARDHDDAVWAEPVDGVGFKAIVAIADVSFYVRPGSALDKEARKRGNSVYFPDRVVPMLPETLSADVCSLKAGADRAALVCHLTIDTHGNITAQRFARAIIRVAANLAYEEAQCVLDGADHPHKAALDALNTCWQTLRKARAKRAPLELEIPERRVQLDEMGRIVAITTRVTRDANRLIEDFMIAANVATAKA
ncbi:MAG: RNB domain-containing ribonuclease, partial [Alphaproteobacteria bacterium]|nr:RNB domain-containing ribonuclease [Alphaproteobacteria bacterium]